MHDKCTRNRGLVHSALEILKYVYIKYFEKHPSLNYKTTKIDQNEL